MVLVVRMSYRRMTALAIIALGLAGICGSPERAIAAADSAALSDLGRRLFFDPSLSVSGKLSCATCHDPRYAYGPPPNKALAKGGPKMDRPGTRAVPSLRYLNQALLFSEKTKLSDGGTGPAGGLTWDGRADSLHEQARIPLLAANEMANPAPAAVVAKLRRGYAAQFKALFGPDVFKRKDFAFEQALLALEAFQHTPAEFYPYSSKYDAYLRGEVQLTDQEKRGLEIFNHPRRGNCANCHLSASVNGVPPAFTDFEFDNIGAPRNSRIAANADPSYYDMGLCGPSRSDLAAQKNYCGLFRTPTLRNVALRDAFFHNGVFNNLREVLQFYQQRDVLPWKWYPRNPDGTIDKVNDLPFALRSSLNIDPPFSGRLGGQLGAISDADIDDLAAFLQTLTDGYQSSGSAPAAVTGSLPRTTT
jgi:cytochrome c peroxidase